uniref:Transcriptional activator protein n=1 Tax=Cotton leaf curl Multan virus - Pakistan TaxID=2023345 RepID=A0A2K8HN75_9GEMI|nr:AC2 [Cotton leaf curl Multan virus - Pakistan]
MRVFLLSVNQLPQPWIHAQGNPSLQLKQGMAHISGRSKSPLFQDHQPRQPSIHNEYGYTHDQDPVQLQHSESSGTAQVFSNLPNLDDLTPSDWSFLQGIQNPSPQISEQSRCNFN